MFTILRHCALLAAVMVSLVGCGAAARLTVADGIGLLVADDVGNVVWRVVADQR